MSSQLKFDAVQKAELEEIAARRKANAKGEKLSSDELKVNLENELVGFALSGGGVRSGATSLGLLHSMHEQRLMEDVDYLSTVSTLAVTSAHAIR